jgi:hypothetical protein
MEEGRRQIASRWGVPAVFGLAIALRLMSAIPFSALHPDEIWQYLEPAYKLIDGHAVVTWDQRAGLRSWLLPEVLAVPMYLGHLLSPHSEAHLFAVRLSMAALSLLIVWAACRLGKALGPAHALIAAFATATWSELVYMAPRALTDSVSASLFAGGAALLLSRARRHDYCAGLLLGLAFVVRIQTAPAIAVLILSTFPEWKARWPRLLVGGLVALALDSAANAAMGAVPMMWIVRNFTINFIEHKSASFGVSPPWAYPVDLLSRWSFLIVPLLLLALLGARRYPALLAAAVAHMAVHSLIPHKEWRFDYLFHVLIVLLAGIGAGSLVEGRSWRSAALVCLGFAGASGFVALQPKLKSDYLRFHPMEEALFDAGAIAPSCAIAIYDLRQEIAGSYALSNTDRSFYVYARGDPARFDLDLSASAFGAIIASPPQIAELPRQFDEVKCYPYYDGRVDWCVLKRAGECKGTPPKELEINNYLKAKGL